MQSLIHQHYCLALAFMLSTTGSISLPGSDVVLPNLTHILVELIHPPMLAPTCYHSQAKLCLSVRHVSLDVPLATQIHPETEAIISPLPLPIYASSCLYLSKVLSQKTRNYPSSTLPTLSITKISLSNLLSNPGCLPRN